MQLYSQPPKTAYSPTVIPDHVPVYRVKEHPEATSGFYADDELYVVGSVIAYEEEPNLGLEPLNALAMDNMQAFLTKLDVEGKKAADKAGKAYISYADAFNNSMALAKQEGKKVSLLNGNQQVPIMGGKRRGPKKASKIDLAPSAPVVGTKGKLSLDGVDMSGRSEANQISETGLQDE